MDLNDSGREPETVNGVILYEKGNVFQKLWINIVVLVTLWKIVRAMCRTHAQYSTSQLHCPFEHRADWRRSASGAMS